MQWVTRGILGLMVLAAVLVLVFGPRGQSATPEGRVRIQYWEKWTGNEADQMRQIVNDFNKTVGADKGIFVEYISMSSVNQKTLVATAAGVPPDVAGVWESQVQQFAAMDALYPLDEMANGRGLTRDYYKPVYYEGCRYDNTLWALPSTPAASALHWNKRLFAEKARELRAAGLDPDRPPQTLDELDRYAAILDTFEDTGGKRRVKSAGYIPLEPGWFIAHTPYWFGGSVYDPDTGRLKFTDPKIIAAFDWVRSYSEKLGRDSMTEFRSGLGGFNSTQNPFLTGDVAMVLQGPWMANYIENLKPSMNRYKMSKEEEKKLPREERKQNYEWGAAPFPSAVPGLENVAYAGMDVLMIPRGSKHPNEAFEFIAYVQRQDVMERINSMHCKNSPLTNVSESFLDNHPNPYIDVFDKLASSPNARGVPQTPVWPEINDELSNASQRVYLLEAPTQQIMAEAEKRAQEKLDRFNARQKQRLADSNH